MTQFSLQQLPWLADSFQRFVDQTRLDKSSHAQLLKIDTALGGHVLSKALAQVVVCQSISSAGACGLCKSCLLFSAGNHPDVHYIHADGNQIKVDQIRALCQSLTSTAQQGGKRVAVIFNSERLNLAAANALLKTLEEPGDGVMILLHTDSGSQLLPTITSRCQLLPFTIPSRQQIHQWLLEQQLIPSGVDGSKIHDVTWCLRVLGGPLKLAESLSSGHYQQLLTYRQDWAESLHSGHLAASLISISEQQIIDALNVLYLYLRHYVLKSNDTNPLNSAKVVELAGNVMQMCQKLSTMPNINAVSLCQYYVLEFKKIVSH